MTAVKTASASRLAQPLTRSDLEDLPQDGRRYELIDGTLVGSPGPVHDHQTVVGNLYLLLRAACPQDLQVILAPFAVALAEDTELQPDLLVARGRGSPARNCPDRRCSPTDTRAQGRGGEGQVS